MCEQSLSNFEYKGMNTVGVSDYTNKHPLSISGEKMSKFNTRQKLEKNETCTKWEVYTLGVYIFNV